MDNECTVHSVVLFILNCVSLFLSAFLSLSQFFSVYPPLYLLNYPSALTVIETSSPQTETHFFVLLSSFSPMLLCVSIFFCAVVTLQFLFIFNLNTFKLCLNWAVINLIMHRHTDDTELHMSACIYTVCVGIHVHTCMSLHRQNIRMQLQKCVWHVRGMIF